MNWFKMAFSIIKTASVTIMPADSSKVYQPMTLSDLHDKLEARLQKYINLVAESDAVKKNEDIIYGAIADMMYNRIEYQSIDGGDIYGSDQYTGSFSFGSYEPLDPDEIAKIIDEWVDHMESVDNFDIIWAREKGGTPISRVEWVRSKGVDPSTRTNWKIVVNKNPSINAPVIPSLNLANANWMVLLNLIMPEKSGEDTESYAGRMRVEELERRLDIAEGMFDSNQSNYTQTPSDSHNVDIPEDATPEERKKLISEQHANRKSIRIFDFGLPKERIISYFNQLRDIIRYCRKHGVDAISWG